MTDFRDTFDPDSGASPAYNVVAATTRKALRVTFKADVVLVGDDVPHGWPLKRETVKQAVQDAVGHSGVNVLSVADVEVEDD